MPKRTLSPRVYSLLQRFVNGAHDGLKQALLHEYAPFDGTPVLELGCGTGTLSTASGRGSTRALISTRPASRRRAAYPDAVFVNADVRALEPEFFAPFRFLFCHAWLHHNDDAGCREIFGAIARASTGTARVLVAYDPLLARPLRNPVGWALRKLDRGDFVRPARAMRALCEPFVEQMTVTPGPWRSPVPGTAMRLVFDEDRVARFYAGAR